MGFGPVLASRAHSTTVRTSGASARVTASRLRRRPWVPPTHPPHAVRDGGEADPPAVGRRETAPTPTSAAAHRARWGRGGAVLARGRHVGKAAAIVAGATR